MNADPLCEWTYLNEGREYLFIVMPDGKCLCFDEEFRRDAQRWRWNGRQYLLREITADRSSIEQSRKREFSVSFEIGKEILALMREAREEFDRLETVSDVLSKKIDAGIEAIFESAIRPSLEGDQFLG
jgi:hypothetical protein